MRYQLSPARAICGRQRVAKDEPEKKKPSKRDREEWEEKERAKNKQPFSPLVVDKIQRLETR